MVGECRTARKRSLSDNAHASAGELTVALEVLTGEKAEGEGHTDVLCSQLVGRLTTDSTRHALTPEPSGDCGAVTAANGANTSDTALRLRFYLSPGVHIYSYWVE